MALISKGNKWFYRCVLFLLVMAALSSKAQIYKHSIGMDLNRNVHGSGDMPGVSMDLRYIKQIKQRFAWYGEAGASINSMNDYFFYDDKNGNPQRNSLRYVTAGLQIGGGIRYSPIHRASDLSIQVGPIVRYQSSSLPYSISTYYPPIVNTEVPVHVFDQGDDPMETVALGARLRIGYSYTFKKGFIVGLSGNYQTDTNADAIYGYGISVGKSF